MLITRLIYAITWFTLIAANFPWRSIRLNDGNNIPLIGFGTFGKVSEIESMGSAVVTALEAGYRLIDSGHFYLNEGVIGKAIANVTRRGIVKRRELFICTKLSNFTGRDAVVPALKRSLSKLKLDYIDLYLIHFPRNQTTGEDYPYVDIWKGMEDAKMLGLTKSIGVSNFNSSNINKILSNSNIRPAVNQIEVNPTKASLSLVAYCQSQNIQVMSYAPFGFAVPRPFNNQTLPPSFDNPTLVEIANKYGKSTSQVFLRYLIDRGTIPIPKSKTQDHIRSNIDVFNFRLTREEVYKISEFDINTAVYSQNGRFHEELFTYIYGKSLQELYDDQESENYHRLVVDEALMNHFGAIVMATRLSGAGEILLIGDVNQLPYIDKDNLFEMKYCRPTLVTSISKELLCTHQNPLDVAYAFEEVYSGIYSSKKRVQLLTMLSYTGLKIPRTQTNTLFLVHTQEEKTTMSNEGYGSGEGSRILTVHEAQGLPFGSVFIINTRSKMQLHDSVPHAVAAVSRHTESCVYFTNSEDDATGRFIRRARNATPYNIVEYNTKNAIKDRNSAVVEALLEMMTKIKNK